MKHAFITGGGDVTDQASVEAALDTAQAQFGSVPEKASRPRQVADTHA